MSIYIDIVVDGRQLKLGRMLAGMTIREMAEAANINRNSVLYAETQTVLAYHTYGADRITAVLLDKGIVFEIDGDHAVIKFLSRSKRNYKNYKK